RGKQKIISGDRHQMPPSAYFASEVVFYEQQTEEESEVENFLAESNSLLEYADSSDFINTYLSFHYRSEHPDLIRFSNAAFYDNRLIPMPETHAYQPLFLHQINGVYGEGLNESEADAITDFVFRDENMLADKSVGIATFNIFQRDLILDKLYEKAAQSKENQDKLNALLQNGLFVKNLENIQGDERDIILISTTFGKDASGKFRQFFGPLSTDKGYQLLNVIITRAKKQLHVFTSFPEEYFTQYETELKQKGNTGKAIVYAFLSYVKWCDKQETEIKTGLLEALVINKNAIQQQNINAAYKNEIEQYLHQHFSNYTIVKNMPFGGFILDFVLKKGEYIVLCIDLENDLPNHAATNYRLKLHKEKMLNKFQIPVFHLWLYDFWKNKDSLEIEIKNKIKS
ncbi:MAG TPA: C-terminal helicase domain-containing protein, partial [Chitinophagales bacterium]|nr:C-terminal helicase domain-containing protein [Chitinophagales bacterium]